MHRNNMFTSGKVQRSIQKFSDYASDLIKSDANTFNDTLSIFMHFCESDPIFKGIHNQLISVDVNFDKWLKDRLDSVSSMAGSGDLSFPTDADHRMVIMYELLRRIQSNSIARDPFLMSFFAIRSNRITDYINAFNEAVSCRLTRELNYRLQDIADSLPQDRAIEVPASMIQVIHHANNVVLQNAIGDGNKQIAKQDISDLENLFGQLRNAAVEAEPEKREEIEETVMLAKETASQTPIKTKVLKILLATLSPTASVLSITN